LVLELVVAATALISLFSLVGIALLALGEKRISIAMFLLVSFSTGAVLGAGFFDLLPEAITKIGVAIALQVAFAGVMASFAIEKIVHWRHHHHVDHSHENKRKRPLGALTLVGGSIHNFLDGVTISAAFIASTPLGVAATFAVACHEVPHQIGNFTLLIYSGYSRSRALLYNFLMALTAVAGGLLFFFFSNAIQNFESFALAFTAGTFVYIAGADLIPELQKEKGVKNSAAQFALILFGAGVILLIGNAFG
jgi:zinc and cadmium transporter